jgi:hypothetical protein
MVRSALLRASRTMELGSILRDAKKLVIGPAKPDPLDAAPQDEGFAWICRILPAASTNSPAPATDQHATGAQCSSGA